MVSVLDLLVRKLRGKIEVRKEGSQCRRPESVEATCHQVAEIQLAR